MRISQLVVAIVLAGAPAGADVLPVNDAVLVRFTAAAKAARLQHPTDPAAAASAFAAGVAEDTKGLGSINLEVSTHKDLGVQFLTPMRVLFGSFVAALENLEELPAKVSTTDVVLLVTPKTMLAPSLTKVVVFHGDDQVAPLRSALEPKAYTNRLGASVSIATGSLSYPTTIFDGTKPVKVLCFGPQGLVKEWSLSADWAKDVR